MMHFLSYFFFFFKLIDSGSCSPGLRTRVPRLLLRGLEARALLLPVAPKAQQQNQLGTLAPRSLGPVCLLVLQLPSVVTRPHLSMRQAHPPPLAYCGQEQRPLHRSIMMSLR
jgi:hypothetical protein